MHVIAPQKIRQARIRLERSQGWVARKCNRRQQAVSKIENGEQMAITEEFAMALVRLLELTPEDVFSDIPASFTAALSTEACISGQEG